MIIFKVKKAQAVIWIIIALVLFLIIILLIFINKKPINQDIIENTFQGNIDSCIRSSTEELVDRLIPQGGFLALENSRKYNGVNVAFLCENIGYYKPCVNQHPLYLTEIKNEIYNYILPVANECFQTNIEDLKNKGYSINESELNMSVELSNDLIVLSINKEVFLKKGAQSQMFNEFSVKVKSPLYNLAKVANEITNQEAKYCYFEYLGYSIIYPRFSIRRFVFSDSTEIYTLTDKESKKEMNIALRGCAIPPGI